MKNLKKADYRFFNKKPWFWPLWRCFFPAADWNFAIFTLGNRIYSKDPITHLPSAIHEYTHCEQHKHSVLRGILWYYKYIRYPKFRVEQELVAYRNQYNSFKSLCPDRERVSKYAVRLAKDLSSEFYNNCIRFSEALDKIRE